VPLHPEPAVQLPTCVTVRPVTYVWLRSQLYDEVAAAAKDGMATANNPETLISDATPNAANFFICLLLYTKISEIAMKVLGTRQDRCA